MLWAVPAAGQSGELIDTPVEKYGYALALPRGIRPGRRRLRHDHVDRPARIACRRIRVTAGENGATLTIWVNRIPVETKNLAGLYAVGRRYDADSINSPGAAIRDLRDLTVEGGYGYWYKEADKSEPAANHRWIAKVFGNGAVYTICVAGPFGEFEAWGPVFERVIASFRLVSTKAE